jgi:cytochrome b561
LANALLAVAALHTIAALTHHWAFRDRTLTRMLPEAAATTRQASSLPPPSSPLLSRPQ